MGPLVSQLMNQLGQFVLQELKKPHNQYHIAKAAEEIIKNIKNK